MTTNNTLASQLAALKNKCKQKELAQAEAKGRLDELYRQLTHYSCTSKEEAQEYIEELKKEVEELKKEVKERIEEVRRQLGNGSSLH